MIFEYFEFEATAPHLWASLISPTYAWRGKTSSESNSERNLEIMFCINLSTNDLDKKIPA